MRYDLLRRSGTIYSDATVLFHPTQRYDFADVISKLNEVVVEMGHGVFKKRCGSLALKD